MQCANPQCRRKELYLRGGSLCLLEFEVSSDRALEDMKMEASLSDLCRANSSGSVRIAQRNSLSDGGLNSELFSQVAIKQQQSEVL